MIVLLLHTQTSCLTQNVSCTKDHECCMWQLNKLVAKTKQKKLFLVDTTDMAGEEVRLGYMPIGAGNRCR